MNDAIRTRQIEIVDESNNVRIIIGVDNSSPTIRILDTRGCERLVCSVDEEDQPQIGLLSESGSLLVGIGVRDNFGTGINIFTPEGKLRILSAIDDRGRVLTLSDIATDSN